MLHKFRGPSIYAICVGLLMGVMWSFFLAVGEVPELQTRPAEIGLHLAAEFGTALLLVVSGLLSLRASSLGVRLQLVGFGMLLYTLIVSPGYYMQRSEIIFTVMFGVLLVMTLGALVLTIRRQKE